MSFRLRATFSGLVRGPWSSVHLATLIKCFISMLHEQCMLLLLVVEGNSVQFWILRSYMLLLKSPVLMCYCAKYVVDNFIQLLWSTPTPNISTSDVSTHSWNQDMLWRLQNMSCFMYPSTKMWRFHGYRSALLATYQCIQELLCLDIQ